MRTVWKYGTRGKSLAERFWEKVAKAPGDGCWLWLAGTQKGYGRFSYWIDGVSYTIKAHRYAWQQLVGPLPEELRLHHKCDNTRCVRPDHLEPKTNGEHVSLHRRAHRRDQCPKGHSEWGFRPSGKRFCRPCSRAACARWREKNPSYAREWWARHGREMYR